MHHEQRLKRKVFTHNPLLYTLLSPWKLKIERGPLLWVTRHLPLRVMPVDCLRLCESTRVHFHFMFLCRRMAPCYLTLLLTPFILPRSFRKIPTGEMSGLQHAQRLHVFSRAKMTRSTMTLWSWMRRGKQPGRLRSGRPAPEHEQSANQGFINGMFICLFDTIIHILPILFGTENSETDI